MVYAITYSRIECLSAFPFYCHLYARISLMSAAYRHTFCDRRDLSRNEVLVLLVCTLYCDVNSGNDVLEFAMSSIVIVFGIWIPFDSRRI